MLNILWPQKYTLKMINNMSRFTEHFREPELKKYTLISQITCHSGSLPDLLNIL